MAGKEDIAIVFSSALKDIIKYDKDENVIWEETRIVNYLLDYAPSYIREIKHISEAFKVGAIQHIHEAVCDYDKAKICLKHAFRALDAADFKQNAVCTVIESYVLLFPQLLKAYREAGQWYLQTSKGGGIDSYRAKIHFALSSKDWGEVIENCKKAIEVQPSDSELYVAYLMAKFCISDESQFINLTTELFSEELYKKAYFYADEDRKKQLSTYANAVHEKIELAERRRIEKQQAEAELRRQEEIRQAQERARIAAEEEEKRRQQMIQENNRKHEKFFSVFPNQISSPHKYHFAMSEGHQVFISKDNIVRAEGKEFKDGQLRVEKWRGISQVAVGRYHTVGLKDFSGFYSADGKTCYGGGTVVTCGNNKNGQREVVKWKNIWGIACGDNFTVAFDNDGKVYVAGKSFKRIDCYKQWPKICKLFSGPDYFVGIDNNGIPHLASLRSDAPNLANISDVIWVACAAEHIVFLKKDGSVMAVGYNNMGQCNVADWKYIVSIAAGNGFTIACDIDGKEYFAGKKPLKYQKGKMGDLNHPYNEVYASHDNALFVVGEEC